MDTFGPLRRMKTKKRHIPANTNNVFGIISVRNITAIQQTKNHTYMYYTSKKLPKTSNNASMRHRNVWQMKHYVSFHHYMSCSQRGKERNRDCLTNSAIINILKLVKFIILWDKQDGLSSLCLREDVPPRRSLSGNKEAAVRVLVEMPFQYSVKIRKIPAEGLELVCFSTLNQKTPMFATQPASVLKSLSPFPTKLQYSTLYLKNLYAAFHTFFSIPQYLLLQSLTHTQ